MERKVLIGVDTNILLRLVLDDDKAQADIVEAWMRERTPRDPGYVPLIVLCEFAWVLTARYHHSRETVVRTISSIMNSSMLLLERPEVVRRALAQYANSSAGFGDCCIATASLASGCEHTVTFDKAASTLPGMRLLR